MATHYEHGPGCTLGPDGDKCDDCKYRYPDWTCSKCHTANGARDTHCVNCGRREVK